MLKIELLIFWRALMSPIGVQHGMRHEQVKVLMEIICGAIKSKTSNAGLKPGATDRKPHTGLKIKAIMMCA